MKYLISDFAKLFLAIADEIIPQAAVPKGGIYIASTSGAVLRARFAQPPLLFKCAWPVCWRGLSSQCREVSVAAVSNIHELWSGVSCQWLQKSGCGVALLSEGRKAGSAELAETRWHFHIPATDVCK